MSKIRTIVFLLVLIAIWQIVAWRKIWDTTLLPGPLDVFDNLRTHFEDGTLVTATAVSLRRVLFGYLISMLLGLPLGIALARSKLLSETFGAVITGAQALPSICWLPLALLWFGLNDTAILFVVVMGSFVSIAIAVQDGVKNLPPTYVRAARTMGVNKVAMVTQVLLPASLPAILTAAKLGWAYAWRALMSGELLFVSLGLGHMLMMGRELADMSQVLAVMGVIVAIGLFTDYVVFASLERAVRDRWGLDRA